MESLEEEKHIRETYKSASSQRPLLWLGGPLRRHKDSESDSAVEGPVDTSNRAQHPLTEAWE